MFIREDVNMYKVRYPVLLDFSHSQFRLQKLDNLTLINPKAIIEINLTDNSLHHITGETFAAFEKMKRLRCDHNRIKTIEFFPSLVKVEYLSMSYNQIVGIPSMVHMSNLQYLDLSNNAITDGFDNVYALPKIRYLYLNGNRFDWDQQDFNDMIIMTKGIAKTLTHLRLYDNPFVTNVRMYKEWIFSNIRGLKHLDGVDYTNKDKRAFPVLQDEPSSSEGEKQAESDDDQNPVVMTATTKTKRRLWKMARQLNECQDRPNEVLLTLREVQRYLDEHAQNEDVHGRVMFDAKVMLEEQRRPTSILEIIGLQDDAKEVDEKETDSRDPEILIQEFLMAVDMLISRQPAVAKKSMGLITTMLSISNENICGFALNKIEEYLEAGEMYSDNVVENLRIHVIGKMQHPKTPQATKELLLRALNRLALSAPVLEALRNMSTIIAGWLQEPDPSYELLSLVATASNDMKIAIELHKQKLSRTTMVLLTKIHRDLNRRAKLLEIVGNMCFHIPAYAQELVRNTVHLDLIHEMDGMFEHQNRWAGVDEESQTQAKVAANLINCLHGVSCHSEQGFEDCLKSSLYKNVLKSLANPKVHPQLLRFCLKAIGGVIKLSNSIDKYIEEMDGAVRLLSYLEGDGYDRMCEVLGCVDTHGKAIGLKHQRDKVILEMLKSIVDFLALLHIKARGDPKIPATAEAKKLCDRLDKADREEKLFALLEVPDDEVKVAVIRCLQQVPLDNYQENEVNYLIEMLASAENLTVGRIEEIIAGIFNVLGQLTADPTHVGERFRRGHADIIHVTLSVLMRNASRDVAGQREEAAQKELLNDACISLLMQASYPGRWPEAVAIMTSRNALEAMKQILMFDEQFGKSGKPVLIEKTGCGQSVNALLHALPTLSMEGGVAKRVLIRLAEVLEGRQMTEAIGDALIPPAHDYENEPPVVREWRLGQHILFVQMHGIEIVLKYLLDNCELGDSYNARHVLDDYTALKNEEIMKKHEGLLAEQHEPPQPVEIARHRLYALVDANPALHHPDNLKVPRMNLPFTEGGIRDSESKKETANSAAAVAASLRVFQSLLVYGSPQTKQRAVARGRSTEFIVTLVGLADKITDGKWFPNGVGANLLSIFTDLMKIENTVTHENETMIALYDVIGQVFFKMIRVLDASLLRVISDNTRTKGQTTMRLNESEELMVQRMAKAMYTMITGIKYIRPTDDFDVNETLQDNLLTDIIDLGMIQSMVHYLFYDKIITRQTWSKQSALDRNLAETRLYVARVVTEYLYVNDELRFDILEAINRMEVNHRNPLRSSFMSYLLHEVKNTTYLHNLERYMMEHNMFPTRFERILCCEWIECDTFRPRLMEETIEPAVKTTLEKLGIHQELTIRIPDLKKRLFVVTNDAFYIFNQQSGHPCSACDESAFCPNGPTLIKRTTFDSIVRLNLSTSGHRAILVYKTFNHRVGQMQNKTCVFLDTHVQKLARLIMMLASLHPAKGVLTTTDPVFDTAILSQLLVEREKSKIRVGKHVDLAEKFVGCVACFVRDPTTKKKEKERWVERYSVISTARFYVIKEDKGMWIVEQMKKQVELDDAEKAAAMTVDETQANAEKLLESESAEQKQARLQAEKRARFERRKRVEREEKELPPYMVRQHDLALSDMDEFQFSHSIDCAVEIDAGSQQFVLKFPDDECRELFREYLLRALDINRYGRAFSTPGVRNTETEPSGTVPIN
eukprot:c19952_g1_i1.p1 GENE.c19952_g1_i1~~c19952_g1_i1.p1  ORF type:complete len:1707 (+),score=304.72 c19952_g1_i1:244-5364(+)